MLAHNFVLVGYSEAAERLVGHPFERKLEDHKSRANHDFPQFVSPFWANDDIPSGIKADKIGLQVFAQQQCRLARERGPADFQPAGRFFIAEVQRGHISIEQTFAFPPRKASDPIGK